MSKLDYKKRLLMARASAKRRGLLDKNMALAKSAAPHGAASLISQANIFIDWMYGLALIAAVLKDLLDWVGIGSLPAIGTVITICVSIFIGFMMLLAGSSGKRKVAQKIVRRFIILAGGTIAEFLFGLNFLPFETLTVLVIYFLVLSERKKEA